MVPSKWASADQMIISSLKETLKIKVIEYTSKCFIIVASRGFENTTCKIAFKKNRFIVG
jgi:hypothetical protein